MAEYAVTFARSARKELESLSTPTIERVIQQIDLLAMNPRPRGCRKLKGEKNLWRVRVGNYRVIYAVFDDEQILDIIRIRHRSEVYK